MTEKNIIPYRIKQARISRGYSMGELADLIGVTRQAISQYELGKYPPSDAILYKIANILHYSVSFFRKPVPQQKTSQSAVFFRSRRSTTKKAKDAAREKIAIFQEIDSYLRKFVCFPDVNIPKIEYDYMNDSLTQDFIERVALNVRSYWNLGDAPIENLTALFQKNGIMISIMNLNNKKIDAFSVWKDTIPYIFLSTEKYSNARLRFTLAHELGHLLLHADYFNDEEIGTKKISEKVEWEADRFAAAFLMPESSFSKDIYSSSIEHFINLKKKWLVSIGAMIYRCDDLELLTFNQLKHLKDKMSYNGFWKKEPLDNLFPLETPFAHRQAFDLILEHKLVRKQEVIDEIGCLPEEIEEYCFLKKGCLTLSKDSSNIIQLKTFLN